MSEDPFARYTAIEDRYSESFTPVEARRFMEHDVARAMSKQLKKSIEDEGLTPESLEHNATIVLDLLGIHDGRVAHEIIRGILDIMTARDVRNANEVRYAFGGDGYPKTLKERRQAAAFASGLTVAGIYQRENRGLESLATEIVELVKARGKRPLDRSVARAINDFRIAVQERTALLRQIHNR
jgi:hypothetical protein